MEALHKWVSMARGRCNCEECLCSHMCSLVSCGCFVVLVVFHRKNIPPSRLVTADSFIVSHVIPSD